MEIKSFLKQNYYLIIIILFIIFSVTLIFNHEPYRDEAQAWLIARDSTSFPDMLGKMRQEGTPPLWHIMLYPLAQLNFPIQSMQILHFIIILAAVILFITKSPFDLKTKLLFPFGYFILYQYNTIARNYGLAVLFLFLIATIYPKRLEKRKTYLIALILLGLTSLHGLAIAIVFGLFFIYELIPKEKKKKYLTLGIALIILFAGIGLITIAIENGHNAFVTEYTGKIIQRTITTADQKLTLPSMTLINAFLPIQNNQLHFIDNNVFISTFGSTGLIIFLIGLALLVLIAYSLMKTKIGLARFLACLFVLELIFWIILSGGMRHYGLIFALFITEAWIYLNSRNVALNLDKKIKKSNKQISVTKINPKKYFPLLTKEHRAEARRV